MSHTGENFEHAPVNNDPEVGGVKAMLQGLTMAHATREWF
jgi:hypothetical protein